VKRAIKVATYNINGINARLPLLLEWLETSRPDIVCLQELKTPELRFPASALEKAGYAAVWQCDRAYNGVAILGRGAEPHVTQRRLPGEPRDTQSRYIEAAVRGIVVGCLYLPNGNPRPGPAYSYKLKWLDRLLAHAQSLLDADVPVILAGDYNVVPTEDVRDVYSPESWKKDALFQPEPRARFQQLLEQGWTDGLSAAGPKKPTYTFWTYWRERFERDAGLRIDHILTSPQLHHRLRKAGVDRAERGKLHGSDHAPVWLTLSAEP
jgi:exodeoxyribonuclease-3